MTDQIFDALIIGAGHAGLSIGYCLKEKGLSILIVEQGRIGESWRFQRWDTFKLNTANHINNLPGDLYNGSEPEGFSSALNLIFSLESYVEKHQLPVKEHTQVLSVEKPQSADHFIVTVSENRMILQVKSKQVIVASGMANKKKVPSFASKLSNEILQIHTSEYRNANQLPDGAVLVIGSGQSGCQIAEDLLDVGRNVYLSTSQVARVPRRYRGKDIMDWLLSMGFFEIKPEEVPDPAMLRMKTPLLSGIGMYGHTLSLQHLAHKGAIILGKMENATTETLQFQNNAAIHVKFADGYSGKVKSMIDEYIQKSAVAAPEPEMDEADIADQDASCVSPSTSLNLKESKIGTIIWATGFSGDFNYLKLPVLDVDKNPVHKNGISEVAGIWFFGLNWLRTQKSGLIAGIADDAAFIADQVHQYHLATV